MDSLFVILFVSSLPLWATVATWLVEVYYLPASRRSAASHPGVRT